MGRNPSTWLTGLSVRRVVPLLLVAAFMLGLLAAPALVQVGRAEPLAGVVSIDPVSLEVPVGSSGTVDVRSDGAANIYGAQFRVTFDPAQLQVLGQFVPGTCPQPDFVATNVADNVAGTVDYAVTQLAPTAPCAGGVIGTIEFECLPTPSMEPVAVPVTLFESILSDPDGTPIPHDVQNGQIICLPGCPLDGQVVTQGDAEAIEVCLDGTQCVTPGPDGSFSFVVSEGELHSLMANSLHHLASEVTGISCLEGNSIDVGQTKLRAGDMNEDGVINILDLTMLGGNFGRTEPTGWGP